MRPTRLLTCGSSTWQSVSCAAALALSAACADDNPGGGAGTGDTGTAGDDASDAADDVIVTTGGVDESTGSGGGDADMGEDSSSSGGGAVEVTISGLVEDLNPLSAMPIPGAQVGVFGDDTITDQSNVVGEYDLGPFAANSWATVIVDPSDDYVGSVIPVEIKGDPVQEDEGLGQVSREFINDQIELLMDMTPAEADLTQSIVIVRLLSKQVLNDGNVTVTMEPAPAAGTFYSPSSPAGAPELDNNELRFPILPVVVYFNVAPADPGTYSFTFEHPLNTCEAVFADAPTFGDHITLIDVRCT